LKALDSNQGSFFLHAMEMERTPTVGLEPTTTRLRALRSAD
jgi:hypothetical protein